MDKGGEAKLEGQKTKAIDHATPAKETKQSDHLEDAKVPAAAPTPVFVKRQRKTQQQLEEEEDEVQRRFHGVFRYHGKQILRMKKSLFIFDRDTTIRKAFVWLVEWIWFDRFITFVILLNSLLLAYTDYQDRVDPEYVSPRNELFAKIDVVFSVIFLIECVCKVISMGFVLGHKHAYLRDGWNWLDFFIVVISIVGWLPFFDAGALKALRTFRILRPLRSINSLPEMRNLIQTLLASIPGLINVLFFLMFIFGIFAIFGVNQFSGELYNRCRTTEEIVTLEDGTIEWPMVDFEGWLCSSDDSCSAQVEEGELLKCGNLGRDYRLSPSQIDRVLDQESIHYGIVGFDEIGMGMTTIFQVLTLEGWIDLTYNYSDANDPIISVAFFVCIVVMGAFFAMNLVLGQIMDSFQETDAKNKEQKELDDERRRAEEETARALAENQAEEAAELERQKLARLLQLRASTGAIIDTVPDTLPDEGPPTDRKLLTDRPDFDNISAINEDPEPEDLEKPAVEDYIPADPLFDSTAQSYFGDSEASFERASRKRASRKGFVQMLYRLVSSVGFNFFIFLLIIANTMTLALYRYDQSEKRELVLSWCNEFFTWAFTAELVFKLIGLGPRHYVRDGWNKFDAAVVTISLIDWAITKSIPPEKIGSAGEALNAFRAMRLLRVLKLARLWGALAKILRQTMASLRDLVWYAGLLFLFMFIFALLGMELFAMGLKYDAADELIKGQKAIQGVYAAGEVLNSPRENFDTIGEALTTIFIVIVGEDWNWIMYGFVRAKGYDSPGWYYTVQAYFMLLMILGNIMLFSLFTAILLKNFEGDMSEQIKAAKEKSMAEAESASSLRKSVTQRLVDKNTWRNFWQGFNDAFSGRHKRRPRPPDEHEEDMDEKREAFQLSEDELGSVESAPQDQLEDKTNDKSAATGPKEARESEVLQMRQSRSILMHYDIHANFAAAEEEKIHAKRMHGTSLFCLSKENGFRKTCWVVSTHKWFDNTILLLIVASTLTLAVETPFDDPNGQKVEILAWIDYFMTGAFTLEALTKIIAFGFIMVQTAYLRDPWNNLDFLIVLSAVAGFLMPPGVNISAVKSLRILRILRPLKIISKNKSLKIALTSLVNSIPKIANLQVIVFFFMFLLAILQTTLLSGKFYRCHTDHLEHLSYREREVGIVDKWDCINSGGEWLNPYLHFDDTLWSLLTLFTVQTTEGWIGVMWDATNAVGVDLQPQENSAPYMVIIFIVLIIIVSMLFLNLFVGVVIETFNAEKDLLSCNQFLKAPQKAWISVQIMTYSVQPQLRTVHTGILIRDLCIDIVTHKAFDLFIMGCIIGNTIVLAIKWYIMPVWVVSVIELVNYIFMVIFTLEAVLKIIAMGRNYFKESWNVFDFTVVVLTALILGITWAGVGGNLGVTSTILRSLRIGRIFRLVKKAQKLQIIFEALLDAVPSMGSLGLLLFLLIFMYAIIGISQFALIKIDGGIQEIEGYYMGQDALQKHANFQSFGNAFLTLFRCATGEAWNSIMFDSARGRTVLFQCREAEDFYTWMAAGGTAYDAFACGNPAIAFGYHMSFQIIVSQVFLNIFIAIIIDSFAGQADAFNLPVNQNAIDEFVEIWSQYDPHATSFLDARDLEQFLIDLAESDSACELLLAPAQLIPEFGGDTGEDPMHQNFDKNCMRRRRYMAVLDIPMYEDFKKVMFYDVLQQLTLLVVMQRYNAKKIKNNKRKLKAISAMRYGCSSPSDDTLGAIAAGRFQAEYDVNFRDFTTGSPNLDAKIELMNELKAKVNEVTKRGLVKKVEMRNKIDPELEGVYTTKHFVYGSFIKEVFLVALAERNLEAEGQRSESSPQPSRQCSEALSPLPLVGQDTEGFLGQIREVESASEQTHNKTSQRQSQAGGEELGAGGSSYAINEPEDDESMQRDTAFMNDKKNLR